MTSHNDEQWMVAEFRQLRQVELALTPRFSNLLDNTKRGKLRFNPLHSLAGFAVVVLTLSIVTVILLRPDYNSGAQLISVEHMPTDFLLETPWSQMASLGTEDQFLVLPDEFLKDLPDEL